MLGNDVVDLSDPETRPETFRARFDERVFSPAERRAIAKDETPHARRWAHWAAKEAAYKLAKQVDASFVFSPITLCADYQNPQPVDGEIALRRGSLLLPRAVARGLRELEIRSFETANRVHAIALPRGTDWEAVVHSVEEIPSGTDPSEAVRDLARTAIARDLGIDVARVSIGRRDKIPTALVDGARSLLALSLSHHGRFVAFAMSLRSEAIVDGRTEAEDDRAEGEPRRSRRTRSEGSRRAGRPVGIAVERRAG